MGLANDLVVGLTRITRNSQAKAICSLRRMTRDDRLPATGLSSSQRGGDDHVGRLQRQSDTLGLPSSNRQGVIGLESLLSRCE